MKSFLHCQPREDELSNDLVTVREAAVMLGLSYSGVMNRIYRKKLAAERMGWMWFIRRSIIEAEAQK